MIKDSYSNTHPVINLLYFIFTIGFSMFLINPVCISISFLISLATVICTKGVKEAILSLKYLLPIIALIILINPLFNHQGITIITYLPWGNPITLESIIYGVISAFLISSVILWFSYFNKVITSDKIIYLFGRVSPSLSLIISMILRFIPEFLNQLKIIKDTQKTIGRDISKGSIIVRVKNAIKIISILITLSMENSIETAKSMNSRGYGLKSRTSYSIYSFNKQDICILAATTMLGLSSLVFILTGNAKFNYFPSIANNLFNINSVILYIMYAILMSIPIIFNLLEEAKWKFYLSKI